MGGETLGPAKAPCISVGEYQVGEEGVGGVVAAVYVMISNKDSKARECELGGSYPLWLFYLCLFVCLLVCLFFETGFLCIALAILELTL